MFTLYVCLNKGYLIKLLVLFYTPASVLHKFTEVYQDIYIWKDFKMQKDFAQKSKDLNQFQIPNLFFLKKDCKSFEKGI